MRNLIVSNNFRNNLLRIGRSVIFFSILVLCWVVFFIKYPEVINGSAIITTKLPPINLYPKSSGYVQCLLAKDGDTLSKNQVVVVMDNLLKYKDYSFIDKALNKVKKSINEKNDSLINELSLINFEMGEITASYNNLYKKIRALNYYIINDNSLKKINSLKNQINLLTKIGKHLEVNLIFMKKEITELKLGYYRNQELYKKGVISDKEIESLKISFLQHNRKPQDLAIEIENNRLRITQLKAEIETIKNSKKDFIYTNKIELLNLLSDVKNQLNFWSEKYLIKSPIDGVLELKNIRSDQEYILSNKNVFSVIPLYKNEDENKIYTIATVPWKNLGKITKGLRVNIKVENYPFKEYGVVSGLVENVKRLPNNQGYDIYISLPKGLITSYNKQISYSPDMKASIEIMIDKRSLIELIRNEIKSVIYN